MHYIYTTSLADMTTRGITYNHVLGETGWLIGVITEKLVISC